MRRADAIVVLGCRIAPSGRPGPAGVRRVAAGAAAFRAGIAPLVVVSGGRRWGTLVEAHVLAAELRAAGVPGSAIAEELCSMSTVENALLSAALLRRLGAEKAAIVTCPWHMPRALRDFRAAGVDAIPVPTAAAPAPLRRTLYLRAHEGVCTYLDAWALRRAGVLPRAALRT
jgi:uncharacterized SAM-binding protein YcdF (DUF218 family)